MRKIKILDEANHLNAASYNQILTSNSKLLKPIQNYEKIILFPGNGSVGRFAISAKLIRPGSVQSGHFAYGCNHGQIVRQSKS